MANTSTEPGAGPTFDDAVRSVSIPGARWWRRLLAFVGPAYMVSVGYMDPGNWATDLAGGSQFGYTLLICFIIEILLSRPEWAGVLGGHGHRALGDLLHGETIQHVRHGLDIPILAVRK
jgi:Mn2+/Fe2+ NRAMP family transporter